MQRYQHTVTIARPVEAVFSYFADMTNVAQWATEDFVSVTREDSGPIRLGTNFGFVTRGAKARSVFVWDVFERPSELEFSGPRLRIGPGWVEGNGGYIFSSAPGGTTVTAWLQPRFGGLLALVGPLARMRNVKLLGTQLARARSLIERGDFPTKRSA
jgi:Polyketide cyclase / dehydrase and lipid transport